MIRCEDCGAVLPVGSDECPLCTDAAIMSGEPGDVEEPKGGQAAQSIEIDGADIDGNVENVTTGGEVGDVDQQISVTGGTVDGSITNRFGSDQEADEETILLVEEAVDELQSERVQLRERLVDGDGPRKVDPFTQLLAAADDASTVEAIRAIRGSEPESSAEGDDGSTKAVGGDAKAVGGDAKAVSGDAKTVSGDVTAVSDVTVERDTEVTSGGHPGAVPVAQALSALTEVERLAAVADPDLKALYVAIEKVVRLLDELDVPVEEDLETFVERQQAFTEGSFHGNPLHDSERKELQELCDRARDAIVRVNRGR